jgi:hypothetical protein
MWRSRGKRRLLESLSLFPLPHDHHIRKSMDTCPIEIFEQIIASLVPIEGGLYDLWQCSLVCRAWRVPTQRVIFRHIRILYIEEWERLKQIAEDSSAIGEYVSFMHFELRKQDPDDIRATALFPNVTHLEFTFIAQAPRLGLALRFQRLISLHIRLQSSPQSYRPRRLPARVAETAYVPLQILHCSYMVLEEVLEWLFPIDANRQGSLRTVRLLSDGDHHRIRLEDAKRETEILQFFLRTYTSITHLELDIPEMEDHKQPCE